VAVERLTAGKLLAESFRVWRKNIGVLSGLGALACLPLLAAGLVLPAYPDSFRTTGDVVVLTYAAVSNALLTGALAEEVQGAMRGEPMRIQRALRAGLARAPEVLAVVCLSSLGIAAGAALLVIPGVIYYVGWQVAVPALVVEHIGVRASFSRSLELTRGHRAMILWVLIALVTVSWAIDAPLARLGRLYIVRTALDFVESTLLVVTRVVFYFRLRALNEPPATSELAEVFR
jgi:hypothetical protein